MWTELELQANLMPHLGMHSNFKALVWNLPLVSQYIFIIFAMWLFLDF
jgi:hypothetical protein